MPIHVLEACKVSLTADMLAGYDAMPSSMPIKISRETADL